MLLTLKKEKKKIVAPLFSENSWRYYLFSEITPFWARHNKKALAKPMNILKESSTFQSDVRENEKDRKDQKTYIPENFKVIRPSK